MARTLVRLTTGPRGNARTAVRHRSRPARPRARRSSSALRLAALLLAVLPATPARAAEVGRDLPPGWTPFVEAGPYLAPGLDPRRPADLDLIWFDPGGSLPAGYESLAREVRSIFRGLGVEVSWRVGGVFGGGETPEVPVILLARDPLGRRRSDRILGLVVPDQEPHRAVWVFQDNVRRALGLPREEKSPETLEALARALSRVVAHEIVHAIAPDTPHAREGLMRHAFDRSFLLGSRAPIDAGCAAAFVSGLAAQWQQSRARGAARTLLP